MGVLDLVVVNVKPERRLAAVSPLGGLEVGAYSSRRSRRFGESKQVTASAELSYGKSGQSHAAFHHLKLSMCDDWVVQRLCCTCANLRASNGSSIGYMHISGSLQLLPASHGLITSYPDQGFGFP